MSSVTDENGSSQSRNAPLIKDAKRKKEKKTKKNGKDREVTEVAETSLNLESRKWKKTKIEAGIEVEGTQEETASEKPKKNKGKDQQNRDKRKAEGLPEGGNTSETVQETTTKKRRRELEMADDVFGRPKKKSKKLDFLDPREDLTLSEQAQKALSYAYTQFQHPKKWKFHKARQNWLIRNFWSDNTIPDVHVPLVLRYFANIQGGAREVNSSDIQGLRMLTLQ
ncbi:hypothetical protein E1B28_004549 [Marasmius oreades]|uniref:WKF domain-containing protein n=1 Tax=Marasmius oreades TaxID=181124 RepID=A0A9P7UYT7_9AGAR|nr:uncharacterized protein E1B28_004549 [Marasmius oreades]KAG7097174.1 hypothetical protein E1B28_004549 [Marasmius oreades]